MAVFQERIYHEDKTEKRRLTTGDVMFLSELQKELNTQPNMGNADPLFWMIIQTQEYPAPEDIYDSAVVIDRIDNGIVGRSLKEFSEFLDSEDIEGVESCRYFNKSCTIKYSDGEKDAAYNLQDLVESLSQHDIEPDEHGEGRFELRYVRQTEELCKDTLFLTHKDCEEHLENYGYNYRQDAHAYAMTAHRSPRYAKLLDLIRQVDWSKLPIGDAP